MSLDAAKLEKVRELAGGLDAVENGVEFDFVDRSGFGEYQLVNSTKRGEMRDDDWQRYLQ